MSLDAIDEGLTGKNIPPSPFSKGANEAGVILVGLFLVSSRRRSWHRLRAVDDRPDVINLECHGDHALPEDKLVEIPFCEFDCFGLVRVSICFRHCEKVMWRR